MKIIRLSVGLYVQFDFGFYLFEIFKKEILFSTKELLKEREECVKMRF